VVALAFPLAVRRLPRSATAISGVRVRYPDGRGILRDLIAETTSRGFAVDDIATEPAGTRGASDDQHPDNRAMVQVTLHVQCRLP
jgi:hypothetical protein